MASSNQKVLLDVLKTSQDDAAVWFNLAVSCDARIHNVPLLPAQDCGPPPSVSLPSRFLLSVAAKGCKRSLQSNKSDVTQVTALELYVEAIARDKNLSKITPKALLNCGQILLASSSKQSKISVLMCLPDGFDVSMLNAEAGKQEPTRAFTSSSVGSLTELTLDAAGATFVACFLIEKANEQCGVNLDASRALDETEAQSNAQLRVEAFAQLGAALQHNDSTIANVVAATTAAGSSNIGGPAMLNDERWCATHCYAFATVLCVKQLRNASITSFGVEIASRAVSSMLQSAERSAVTLAATAVQSLHDLTIMTDLLLKLLTNGAQRKLDASHCGGEQSGRALELLLTVFDVLAGVRLTSSLNVAPVAAVTFETPSVTIGSLMAAIKSSSAQVSRRHSTTQGAMSVSTAAESLDELTLLAALICATSQLRSRREDEFSFRLRLGELLLRTEVKQDDSDGVLDRHWKLLNAFVPALRPLPQKRPAQQKLIVLLADVLAPVLRAVLLEPTLSSRWCKALLMLSLACVSDDPFELPAATAPAASSPVSNSLTSSPTKAQQKKLQKRASLGAQGLQGAGSPTLSSSSSVDLIADPSHGLLVTRRALLVEFVKREPFDPRGLNAIARCLSDTSADDSAVDVAHLLAPLPSLRLLQDHGNTDPTTLTSCERPNSDGSITVKSLATVSIAARKAEILLESLHVIHRLRMDGQLDCLLRQEIAGTLFTLMNERDVLMRLELEAMVELCGAMSCKQVLSLPLHSGSPIRVDRTQLLLTSYLLLERVQATLPGTQTPRYWLLLSCGDENRIAQRLHASLYQWIVSEAKAEQVVLPLGNGTSVTIRKEDLAAKLVVS